MWTDFARVAVVAALLQGCAPSPSPDTVPVVPRLSPPSAAAFLPLEPPAELDPARVALGRRLFSDPRLSADGTISCASCHDLKHGGAHPGARAIGIGGAEGLVNAPSVLNRSLDPFLFWDGRARSLEDQVGGPLTDPLEMGASWEVVVARLRADGNYALDFADAFGRPPDESTIRESIAEFERGLVSLNSPFDRYLRGDEGALSPAARRGFARFGDHGCSACHQGRNLGGNMFQAFGIYGDYFADRGDVQKADLGRFNVTSDERDRHVFKVPSLRGVAQTAPYLHDGTATTLDEVVRTMARYQIGRELPDSDVDDIVAFLNSLTGDVPDVVAQ